MQLYYKLRRELPELRRETTGKYRFPSLQLVCIKLVRMLKASAKVKSPLFGGLKCSILADSCAKGDCQRRVRQTHATVYNEYEDSLFSTVSLLYPLL